MNDSSAAEDEKTAAPSPRAAGQVEAMRIVRGFIEIDAGQLHYRTVRSAPANSAQSDATPANGAPANGALDSNCPGTPAPPLICLHQSPFSSLTYQEILPLLAIGRPVIALDTPGFDESFRPSRKPGIADYASWLSAAVHALGFSRFDLMGLFTGAAIAAEMAVGAPDRVRRVVLLGPPLFTPAQQQQFLDAAWPLRPRPDGSHLLPEWERVMTRALPGVPFARRCDAFQEFWRGGADAIWGEEAVSVYPLRDTLPRLPQPVLVLEPDGLLGQAARATELIPNARRLRLPGVHAWSMMQTAPERIAAAATAFLNADPDTLAVPPLPGGALEE